eukprot:CAMPEP_0115692534 /NCGR_PEP_ID=MMETSP0272-20121206/63248_1 /TAXON_ID=71861 /ORGANISM="Scrippsiella trochoidea, Strain CCMP3099" /LENGTH=250 /DNA_ID=CAMNT_0003132601 /DNA_START=1 /DNA_END=753 /DNA_ORIENTATION=-
MEVHGHADGLVAACESGGLARSESMDIANDPRFFTGNVIDKRMAAFSGLSVVSTIMVSTALGECYGMKKSIDLSTTDGVAQIIGFAVMNSVLFMNVLTTYVCVSQVYFVYRLMTAGPTGFEMASSFYLNPNIAFWRHAGVKTLLMSLPTFVVGSAFRMLKKFDNDMPGAEAETEAPIELPWYQARVYDVSVMGIVVCSVWCFMALLLYHVNNKHQAVFKERYAIAKDMERPLLTQVSMLSARGVGRTPDV